MTPEVENAEQGVQEPAPESANVNAALDTQQTDEQEVATTENEEAAETEEQPQRTPWYQKRIDELTRARREAERRAEANEALLKAFQENESFQQPQGDNQYQIEQRATELARQRAIDDAANRTYHAGKESHPDFDNAVQGLNQLGEIAVNPTFLEAVTALPNGHEVYYHLGTKLDDAAHILSLPPVQMAIELANLSARVGKPKKAQVSNAPAPASETVSGSASPGGDLSDDLPLSEWMARRNKQVQR